MKTAENPGGDDMLPDTKADDPTNYISYTGDQRREFSYHQRQFIYNSAIRDRDSKTTKNYNNDSELNRVSRAALRNLDKFRYIK